MISIGLNFASDPARQPHLCQESASGLHSPSQSKVPQLNVHLGLLRSVITNIDPLLFLLQQSRHFQSICRCLHEPGVPCNWSALSSPAIKVNLSFQWYGLVFISFSSMGMALEVTDGLVVRAGVSVTWNVLSWSGGHEFEPRSGRTWGAWYFCPKSYLN